jgi:hypothetical protein
VIIWALIVKTALKEENLRRYESACGFACIFTSLMSSCFVAVLFCELIFSLKYATLGVWATLLDLR